MLRHSFIDFIINIEWRVFSKSYNIMHEVFMHKNNIHASKHISSPLKQFEIWNIRGNYLFFCSSPPFTISSTICLYSIHICWAWMKLSWYVGDVSFIALELFNTVDILHNFTLSWNHTTITWNSSNHSWCPLKYQVTQGSPTQQFKQSFVVFRCYTNTSCCYFSFLIVSTKSTSRKKWFKFYKNIPSQPW